MKLQVNLAGSWRDVLHFEKENVSYVKDNARDLPIYATGRVSMRLADDKNAAIAHCAAPDFKWKDARRGR